MNITVQEYKDKKLNIKWLTQHFLQSSAELRSLAGKDGLNAAKRTAEFTCKCKASRYFKLYNNGKVIGYTRLDITASDETVNIIRDVYIIKAYRGQKLYKQVILFLIEKFDMECIELCDVSRDQHAPFYQNLDFVHLIGGTDDETFAVTENALASIINKNKTEEYLDWLLNDVDFEHPIPGTPDMVCFEDAVNLLFTEYGKIIDDAGIVRNA